LTSSASPIILAAIDPGANLVDAEVFGNFIARNNGLGISLSGFGARGGLKNVFGSYLVGETPNYEERNKHCENQNDCHCLILRPFVSGSCFWNYRGFQLLLLGSAYSMWPLQSVRAISQIDARDALRVASILSEIPFQRLSDIAYPVYPNP
jgi:hypothetical protein